MLPYIDVSTGEIRTASVAGTLLSSAIGSCIVISAHNPLYSVGIMAHIMLPGKSPPGQQNRYRYASDALLEMLHLIQKMSISPEQFNFCLAGAANILKKPDDSLCSGNIRSVSDILCRNGFVVRAASLGGVQRRRVRLDIQTGQFYCANGDNREELLFG